jgi:hypothetical protein
MDDRSEFGILKVGEAYIRFDLEFNETNRFLVKEVVLRNFHKHESYRLLGIEKYSIRFPSIKYSIEFDEGSLKTNIIIWATSLYIGIGQYGSFKAGLREASKDIKIVSTSIIKSLEDDPSIGTHRIRTENRLGILGRINEIYSKIDSLERKIPEMTDSEVQNQLNIIKQDIANLSSSLPTPLKQEYLQTLDGRYSQNLPEPNQKKVNYYLSRYFLKPNEIVEFIEE